jgi:hypothetical protein
VDGDCAAKHNQKKYNNANRQQHSDWCSYDADDSAANNFEATHSPPPSRLLLPMLHLPTK